MNLTLPYQFNEQGGTASVNDDQHIRNMIEQILFTRPGERVNRPNFGSGLLQAVFEPNSNEMAATTQYLVQGALNQWLSHLIEVNEVKIDNIDSTLEITIAYTILKNKEKQLLKITR